jgi:hypothetical protein
MIVAGFTFDVQLVGRQKRIDGINIRITLGTYGSHAAVLNIDDFHLDEFVDKIPLIFVIEDADSAPHGFTDSRVPQRCLLGRAQRQTQEHATQNEGARDKKVI